MSHSLNDRPELRTVTNPICCAEMVLYPASEVAALFGCLVFLFRVSSWSLVSLVSLWIILECQLSQSIFSSSRGWPKARWQKECCRGVGSRIAKWRDASLGCLLCNYNINQLVPKAWCWRDKRCMIIRLKLLSQVSLPLIQWQSLKAERRNLYFM